MKTIESLKSWIRIRTELKLNHRSIGFVPTMGALHTGHMALIQRAREENDIVVASIFVNPTQFNSPNDLEKYPRRVAKDAELLAIEKTDYLILPNFNEIYPDKYRYKVTESEVSKTLCGAHRPGHFDGVLTIVLKLLALTGADRCYLGEKDYQQFLLVREMGEAFFLPTEIVPCSTVRESSGLAMSSRNERLSEGGKQKAAQLYQLLNSEHSTQEISEQLIRLGFQVDYCEEKWGRRFVAATLEGVRLIDNVEAK